MVSQPTPRLIKRKPVPALHPEQPARELTSEEIYRLAKLRKIEAKLGGGPRSCHSDNASTSSLGEDAVDEPPKFDLEASFPSIFVPLRLIRTVAAADNSQSIPPLASTFGRCVRSVLDQLHQLSWEVRLNPVYKVGQLGIYASLDVLECQARTIGALKGPKATKAVKAILQLLDDTMDCLTGFLALAEGLVLECEPVLVYPETIAEDTASSLSSSLKPPKKGVLARVLWRASKASSMNKGPPSSVNTSPISSNDDLPVVTPLPLRQERLTKKRFSLLVFPDPENADVEVTLPLPSNDALNCTFTPEGQISGATLQTLLRILTSKEAVVDFELTQIVLISFRFFSDPLEFFQGLLSRYEEEPSCPLTLAQKRVWEVESKHVKLRVAKVLLVWLEIHWRQDTDNVIFAPLSEFCATRMKLDFPASLCEKIVTMLSRCQIQGQSEGTSWRMRRRQEINNLEAKLPQPPSLDIRVTTAVNMLHFQSHSGQVELAKQLTLAIVQQYKTVDPMDALVFWHKGEGDEVGRKLTAIFSYERSVSLWVTQSVLALEKHRERAMLVGLFINVAWRCVKLRNFASALSIYTALGRSCITRLRDTNTEITEEHRKKYKKLSELFPSGNDWSIYRNALSSSEEAAVPPFAVLIRDVDHASEKMTGLVQLEKESGMWILNINRYRILANTIQSMEMIHLPYQITFSDKIQKWLTIELEPLMGTSNKTEEIYMQLASDRSQTLEARDAKQAHPSWKRKIDLMISREKVELPPWCKV